MQNYFDGNKMFWKWVKRAKQGTSDNVNIKIRVMHCENVKNYRESMCPQENVIKVRLAYVMVMQFV